MDQKFSYGKFFLNIALTAGSSFIATYQTTGSVKLAAFNAAGFAIANVLGLVQKPPQAPKV